MARVLCFFIVAAFVTTDAAPKGYSRVDTAGGYLKLYRDSLVWNRAVDTCAADGGFLYTPENESELDQVIRLLGVDTVYMHVGISDVDTLGVYMTVDGRPISQVFNQWRAGEPNRCSDNQCRCAQIHVPSRRLAVYGCTNDHQNFICKIEKGIESLIMTDIKMAIGNSSDRVIGLLERQNTALEQLSQGITNQANAAARRMETAQRQVAASYRLMESLQQQSVNQTALLDRLAESAGAQNTVLGLLLDAAKNQTTIMTQMLERLQEEDNNSVNVRSEQ